MDAELERRIPENVKVIGADDAPICLCGPVELSSVSLNVPQRARRAVRPLLNAVAGKKVDSVTFEPILRARGSTGVVGD